MKTWTVGEVLELSIAYGLPGSGKTAFLKQLEGVYLDYDSPSKRHDVNSAMVNLREGKYILDFMLFRPDQFVNLFFHNHPDAKLNIYQFEINRELSRQRDIERARQLSSTALIDKMQLFDITPHKNLKVIKV